MSPLDRAIIFSPLTEASSNKWRLSIRFDYCVLTIFVGKGKRVEKQTEI